MKVYPSIFDDEQKLLKAIIDLHCPVVDEPNYIVLDPMYSRGNFYKEILKPRLRSDINPQDEITEKADAKNLPIKTESIKSMILDPPFCFGIHGKVRENISAKRFTVLQDFKELEELYKGILKEAYRILEFGGVLIFKCQDYTDSKTTITHCLIYNWATELGFYAKDLAIFIRNQRIYNPNLKQRHFRKTHSYFWVFQKPPSPKG